MCLLPLLTRSYAPSKLLISSPSSSSYSLSRTRAAAADDTIFGAEFKEEDKGILILTKNKDGLGYKEEKLKQIDPLRRQKVMTGYDNMRSSFVVDSIFVSLLGLCATWSFGTYRDAISYGIGALLGGAYAVLLGSFVEKVGSEEKNTSGNLRFAPVILLIAVYSKNKEYVSILPELLGFFSYQIGSLLQIFNKGAYETAETSQTDT